MNILNKKNCNEWSKSSFFRNSVENEEAWPISLCHTRLCLRYSQTNCQRLLLILILISKQHTCLYKCILLFSCSTYVLVHCDLMMYKQLTISFCKGLIIIDYVSKRECIDSNWMVGWRRKIIERMNTEEIQFSHTVDTIEHVTT